MWDERTQEIWIMQGRVETLMERTCILLLILLFLGCNLGYILLPDTIPLHINALGDGDDFMSKAYFFVLPSIGIFLYFAITLLSKGPVRVNYEDPRLAEMHYRSSTRTLLRVKLMVLIACTIEMGETVRLSYKEFGRPGWPATIWEALLLLTPLIYYLAKLRAIRKGTETRLKD